MDAIFPLGSCCGSQGGVKQLGAAVLSHVPGQGEGTVGTRSLGVYATLRNVFTVEVRELFNQVKVIEKQRATRACH